MHYLFLHRIRYYYPCVLLFFLYPLLSFAQTDTPPADFCATSLLQQRFLDADSLAAKAQQRHHQQIQQLTQQLLQNTLPTELKDLETAGTILTIPVVVHIIHNPQDALGNNSNITDEQVYTGIQHLNDAFRNVGFYNPSDGVDTEIEFCLASRTPTGQSTNGINRYASSTYTNLDFDTEEPDIKQNTIRWDATQYMNIWLVDEICSTSSSSSDPCRIAAYAFTAGFHGGINDGIVCEHRFFGLNENDSKVLIHEVGHYLDLYHTFEGGCQNNNCLEDGDYICDTPPDGSSGAYACANIPNTCSSDGDDINVRNPFRPMAYGGLGDQPDPIDNYMDYGYRSCKNAFTAGQKSRMRLTLASTRSSLLNSLGCFSVYSYDAGITHISLPNTYNCNSTLYPTFTITNFGGNPLYSATIQYQINGGNIYTHNWTGSLASSQSVTVQMSQPLTLATNTQTIYAYCINPNSFPDQDDTNNGTTRSFNYTNLLQPPFSDNFETTAANPNWLIVNPDNGITWQSTNTPGCSSNSSKSLYLNNYNYSNGLGQYDIAFTRIDLSSYAIAALDFDVAYIPYSVDRADNLKVIVSDDCGATFHEIYNKSGTTLATNAGYNTQSWKPQTCNQWRHETLNLNAYIGSDIMLGFVATSQGGNNLYIDNIAVAGATQAPCAMPFNITVQNIGYIQAQAQWSSVEVGSTHSLRYRKTGTSEWLGTYNNISPPFTLVGLSPGTTYELQIQTTCSSGVPSGYSNSFIFTTDYDYCLPPFDANVIATDLNQANLSWTPATNATYYWVSYGVIGQAMSSTATSATPSITLNGLLPYTTYQASVKSICANGETSFTGTPFTFTTYPACNAPYGAIVSTLLPSAAYVEWHQEDNALAYQLEYRAAQGNWSQISPSTNGYLLNNLTPETNYEVRLRSICLDYGQPSTPSINSNYGPTLLFTTPPVCNVTTDLSVSATTDNTAVIHWQNRPEAQTYKLRYKLVNTLVWQYIETASDSVVLYGLMPCSEYLYAVQTICGENNESNYTLAGVFTTTCNGYCVAGADDSSKEWIEQITIGTANNISGNNNGYESYLNFPFITFDQGNSYDVYLLAGRTRRNVKFFWDIWIDFNQNQIFENTELVFSDGDPLFGFIYTNSPDASGTVHIPANAPSGSTRMRVALRHGAHASSCGSFPNGEVEDYSIQILNLSNKTTPPNPAAEIMLFPNPTNAEGGVFVRYQHFTEEGSTTRCSLTNSQGAQVWQQYIDLSQTSGIFMLPTETLPKGIYFFQIGSQSVQKLVVQ